MWRMWVLVLAVLTGCWRNSDDPVRQPELVKVTAPPIHARSTQVLTPEIALETVSTTYMPQLRRCYQLFLNSHGSAQGKVMLAFTVDPQGKVVSASAYGVAPELTTCITQRMARWEFPPPRGTESATFRIPLQLVAN